MIRKLSCALLIALPISAQSNLLTNGSFESGPAIPTGQTEIVTAGWTIPGWLVSINDVDYNAQYWQPTAGLRSISLHGNSAGRIQQTVNTLPGASYELRFDMGVSGAVTMGAQALTEDGVSPIFQVTGIAGSTVTYQRDLAWSFKAGDDKTTICFESKSDPADPKGPHIDNARLFLITPRASFTPFGNSCYGTAGAPTLSNTSRPVVGSTLSMRVTGVITNPDATTFGLAGISRHSWSGLSLPLHLDPYGAPNCDLLISVATIRQLERSAGITGWTLRVPPGTPPGLTFYVQAASLDRNANAMGMVLSNAAEVIVGLH